MKTTRFILLAVLMFTAVFTVKADNDKPISFEQLPLQSQEFIEQHFSKQEVSYAKMERDLFSRSYEVFLVNGTKIEFDKKGEWETVDCRKEAVPAGIIPQGILDYVKERHPDRIIVEIEREKKYYEIKLNNGIEIKFSKQMAVIGYDD